MIKGEQTVSRKITRNSSGDVPEVEKKQARTMTSQNKTPITILQELAAKVNPKNLPVYTEITEPPPEYADTTLRFFIRCQALGHTVYGGGVTKKTAKHDAAERLLRKYRRNYDEDASDGESSNATVDSNYITELLDYCTLKDFHKPSFECIDSFGPSHAPSFTFECKLDSIRREATADNKKLAKQLSAKAVLEEIKTMSFPDLEKKVQKIDKEPVNEAIRQKITNYRQLKQQDKVAQMGTLLKDRCEFFLKQDETLLENLRNTLASTELDEGSRYDAVVKEFAENPYTKWESKIEPLGDTGLLKYELMIDYEKFTCVILSDTQQRLKKEVLEYFQRMVRDPKSAGVAVEDKHEPLDLIYL